MPPWQSQGRPVTQPVNRPDEVRKFLEMKHEVEAQVEAKYKNDPNPITQFLLSVGVLVDLEALRRMIMMSDSNSSIFMSQKKIDALRDYVAIIKDTAMITEKTIRQDAAARKLRREIAEEEGSMDNFDVVEVHMNR